VNRFQPHLEILSAPQQRLWRELAAVPRHFVLYGGTGVALRLGHRSSVDFDFFSTACFNPQELRQTLPWLGEAELLQSKPNTLTVVVDRNGPVKVSFFGGLLLGRVGEPELTTDGVCGVASLLDLAATKAAVVQQRAERRDYVDLASLLRAGITLPEALGAARVLYGETFSPMITLKALGYFKDGDLPQLPDELKRLLSHAASEVTTIPAIARQSDNISPDAA
jgi:hypothetical protein